MIGIVESGRRARQARDRTRVLFETIGRWVPTEEDPGAKLVFARWSRRHAWHAELWATVVPVLHDVDLQGPREPGEELGLTLGPDMPRGTDARLDAYAAELAAFTSTLAGWQAEAVAESDGPILRVAGIVQTDLTEAVREVRAAWAGLDGATLPRDGAP
jgi:hypothetical protein